MTLWTRAAPFVSLCLNLASLVGCLLEGNHGRAIYWLGAAIITASMTFF